MCTLKYKRKTVNKCRFKIPTKSAQKHTNEYENTTWLTISFVIGDWTWDVCMYICSAFLWRYEPVQRTRKSHDWLTVFFARIIRFAVQKFQLFWVIFLYHYFFFIELWHILILWLAKMPNGGMPVFTLTATGWWYRKIFFYKKSTVHMYAECMSTAWTSYWTSQN